VVFFSFYSLICWKIVLNFVTPNVIHCSCGFIVTADETVTCGCREDLRIIHLLQRNYSRFSLHQQIGLRAKEETSEVLHLEHCFVWCGNLDSSETRSEVPGNFRNVVLEKDGEDKLDGPRK
jgi:hypothetical protein